MKKNEFIDSLKTKTVRELLELLNQGQSGELKIEPDHLQEVIEEINNRQLSEAETSEFESLINFFFDGNKVNENKNHEKYMANIESSNEFSSTLDNNERDPKKYTALKTVSGLISSFANLVIVIGIGVLIFLASHEQIFLGFIAIVLSFIIALPMLAFSNLIYVFIDIEYKTRKTSEVLKKTTK